MNSRRQAQSTQWDLTYKRPEEGGKGVVMRTAEEEADGAEGKGGRSGEKEKEADERDINVLSLL